MAESIESDYQQDGQQLIEDDSQQLIEHDSQYEGIYDHFPQNDPIDDVINEAGNMGFQYDERMQKMRRAWQLNHQEAAIYLQEGENNDKFYTHPRSHEALPAYQLAHNHWFYALDLFGALLALSLAACERPAVDAIQLPVGVHGSLEVFALLILSLELGIRMKWLGWRVYFHHPRTIFKTLMVLIMLVEAVVVLIRQHNHFRVTRALRPLFLLNCHYSRGVRRHPYSIEDQLLDYIKRIARQILQSLPPIFDMLMLLIFIMIIFSLLGFYAFSTIKGYQYFGTLQDSFISLFVLLTTANYPDVMMAAYDKSRLNALFFISYLAIELYFIMNLFLAVVYDTFSGFEKKKLRKLFFHKREGCQLAFRLLVTKKDKQNINLRAFMGLLKYFRPKMNRKGGYLLFKALNTTKTGKLNLEEFYKIYDFCDVKWKPKNAEVETWSSHFRPPFKTIFKCLHALATWRWFEYFICLVIVGNFFSILVEGIQLSINIDDMKNHSIKVSYVSVTFICIYCVEAIIKILGKGPKEYFSTGWDLFDFLVTLISLAGVIAEAFKTNFYYIVVLRPFRLLRLFKIKKRYRDVLGTLFMLMNRLSSLVVIIILVYYFFAIIAMEAFLGSDLTNCCKNTSVEINYELTNTSKGYYYLNNFDNVFVSGVTLFELTVVNNWYIIMDGYAHHIGEWSRVYFMSFYIVMMVVITIVVAFILELFLFRITYRRTMQLEDIEDHEKFKVDINLGEEEEVMCNDPTVLLTGNHITIQSNNSGIPRPFTYKGERSRSKEDFSLRMYKDEVLEWIETEKKEREFAIHDLDELRRTRRHTANSQVM